MRLLSRLAPVIAVVAMAAALTGCGGSTTNGAVSQAAPTANGVESLGADEILATVKKTANNQSSVYLVGKGGQGSDALALDLRVRKGGGSTGSIELGGDKLQLITTGSEIYIKADKEFWAKNVNAAAAEVIGNRWLKAPASDPQWGELGNFGNFDKVVNELLIPSSSITKGEQSEVDGTKAIGLTSTSGTLWVAMTGEPLPLRIDAKEGGAINLKDWSAPVDVQAPPADEVIDVTKVQSS